jgi:hypothetical protein
MKYLALTFLVLTATVVAADPVPQNLDELWADFPAKDKETPLEVEILKTWEE